MSNTNVLTLKIPMELKRRLERQAKYQGTSINQLTYYLLTTQLETLAALDSKLSKKSIPDLKAKVKTILDRIPDRTVPAWDSNG
ncbi:MAG: hypothetical protein KAW12_21105 [Candidatus Aminicenantes bacterium]|nr:hypothetical protein [Candidatus Aminicenantes bacterium]